mmetsp:Transcript_23111/g.17532  ORF Transcript_23111/g.17532 Transcript_23111/m.17532 type:complete len:95 (+) Transcript_23111:127-411(+)
MIEKTWDFVQAYTFLKKKRPLVKVNQCFVKELLLLDKDLDAKREIKVKMALIGKDEGKKRMNVGPMMPFKVLDEKSVNTALSSDDEELSHINLK